MGESEEQPLLVSKVGKHEEQLFKGYIRVASHVIASVLIVAQLAANLWYLIYKIRVYSQNLVRALAAPWVVILLLCECAYFVCAVMVATHNLLLPRVRPRLQLDLFGPGKNYPSADIFISCFKEPLDVLQDSIAAALAVHYPQDRFRVLVLDDGGDDDLRALCTSLQEETAGRLEYIRRVKIPGAPKDFKCGNMNHGLKHSSAEYVMFLDADMIAHPSILQRLLPFIVDSPEIGFVQTPQSFYNLPFGDPLDDSNTVFHQLMMPQRDQLSCASFLGTGAVFRREGLVKIGGFQPGSVTEDTLTAYVLFNNGYRSVYVNERLQAGLAPWTFQGYVEQRQRWAIGSMQQFGLSWKAMLGFRSKLSFLEQIWYFFHTTNHFLSLFNLVLMLVLLGALAFRLDLVVTDDVQTNRELMGYLGLHLVLLRLSWIFLWVYLPRGVQSRNRSEAYFWWISPFYFRISLQALFRGSHSFSSKFLPTNSVDQASAGNKRPLDLVWFHIGYALVSVVVVFHSTLKMVLTSGLASCNKDIFTLGLSFFLVVTSANLLVPVLFILRSRGFKPEQRRALLGYDASGKACYPKEADLLPKRDWSIVCYEIFADSQLAFWSAVLIVYLTGSHDHVQKWWCTHEQNLGAFLVNYWGSVGIS